jgi:Zn-dependent M28 family amino/carboxypeptidase
VEQRPFPGEFPDEIIALGGHLDSWDIGEGAHDDGAGIVHTW